MLGVVREAARLENSDFVAAASVRALSAMGPLESVCTVLLFFTESIVDEAAGGELDICEFDMGSGGVDC